METRASYLLVGAFMLALMAAAVGFVIWVTGTKVEKTEIYHMLFKGSVTGLQVGGQVRFRGIPVGEITSLNIIEDRTDPKEPIKIDIVAKIRADTPIRKNTRAVVESLGLAGAAFVQLKSEPVTGPNPRIVRNSKNQELIIKTKPSQLAMVFQTAPDMVAAITLLASRGALLLDNENLTNIKETVKNLRTLTVALISDAQRIQTLIGKGGDLLDTTRTTMAKGGELLDMTRATVVKGGDLLDTTQATVVKGGNLLDTTQATVAKAGKLIDNVNPVIVKTLAMIKTATPTIAKIGAAAKNISGAATSIQGAAREARILIRNNQQPIADFTSSGLYEFSKFLIEARQLVAALLRISKTVEDDPARFFFGNQQRGYQPQQGTSR